MLRLKTALFVTGILIVSIAHAQQLDRSKLIVAYVNSFAKNIEWPTDKNNFRIHVISDNGELRAEFEELAKSRKIKGKPIHVSFSRSLIIPSDVSVVFLDSKYNTAIKSIANQINDSEVLLISDGVEDQHFIMINFIPLADGKLSFEINRANIINQKLVILPEMFLLGGTEVDVAKLYREAQDSVRAMEGQVTKLQKRYDSIALNIKSIQAVIQNQNIKIDEQIDEIYEKQFIINRQSVSLDSLTSEYESSLNRLDSIKKSMLSRERESILLQAEINNQSSLLDNGNKTLQEQKALIHQQDEEIKSRESRLQEMRTLVDSQKNTLLYLILFLIIVVAFSIVTYQAYSVRKRDAKKLMEQKEELSILVTELHQAQSQLVHSEKMASLGVLTAGIAHEINNAINFVYSGIQIVEMRLTEINPVVNAFKKLSSSDKELKATVQSLVKERDRVGYNEVQELIDQMIESIQVGVERTTEIVRGLRSFSRTEEEEKVKVDIHKDIDIALLLLKSRYKDIVEVKKKYDERIPEVEGFQGQLSQAFLNIINNAIDAVSDKAVMGKITIETYLRKSKIEVKIKDNGPGIPKDHLDKIFDPFFTTKKIGAGTGLGLSITYGIIEKHRGTIRIQQHKKNGAEFIITLPLGDV